jgi:hypothetical protein
MKTNGRTPTSDRRRRKTSPYTAYKLASINGPRGGHSMTSEPNFQHSDLRMKLSICEAKIMNSFGDFFKI